MINQNQLKELIIKPVLNELILESRNAEEIILFTCAVESMGGYYLKQLNGPALGIYQMEPETHTDIWNSFIISTYPLNTKMTVNFGCNRIPSEERLIYDLRYATAMVRIHYARVKESLPLYTDINAIWEYYKKYYNTSKGAAEKESSISKYKSYNGLISL